MSLLRKLLAAFFALWMPFSAVAAAMMPMCAHDRAKQMHSAHAAEQGGEHHHSPSDQPPADEGAAAGDCALCGLCMFACTPWLPGTQSSFDATSSFAVIDGIFPAFQSLVFPPADRPPLSAA
jgi:ABC-type nickel/cobalt efflux system permease component RcnA